MFVFVFVSFRCHIGGFVNVNVRPNVNVNVRPNLDNISPFFTFLCSFWTFLGHLGGIFGVFLGILEYIGPMFAKVCLGSQTKTPLT